MTILHKNKINTESGSVFFYILIAIFLFATLTYILSDNSRTNASIITEEQAKVAAQEIIEYGDAVANAVQKLVLRGCSDTEISFENDVIVHGDDTKYYTTHDVITPDECKVHNTMGGGIGAKRFAEYAEQHTSDPIRPKAGSFYPHDTTFTNQGSNNIDLLLHGRRLKKQICLEINNILNVPNPANNIPIDNLGGSITNQYKGAYNGTGEIGNGESADAIQQAQSGCVNNGGDHFHYYRLLIAR